MRVRLELHALIWGPAANDVDVSCGPAPLSRSARLARTTTARAIASELRANGATGDSLAAATGDAPEHWRQRLRGERVLPVELLTLLDDADFAAALRGLIAARRAA